MKKIAIITASVREGRKSGRVSLFLEQVLKERGADTLMLDLAEFNFPLFSERLRYQADPPANVLAFAESIRNADGVLIVTPEYNGGYPASLKNVTDLLYDEWRRKPVAICTVSSGAFGGTQVITSLQFTLWKIGALTVPAMFPVPDVEAAFDESGHALASGIEPRAKKFIDELLFYVTVMERHAAGRGSP